MDLIYKIYSVYLYDNQVEHQYILLCNHSLSWNAKYSLPWEFSGSSDNGAMYKIFNYNDYGWKVDDVPLKTLKSIEIMEKTAKSVNIPLIKNNEFLIINVVGNSYKGNYNVYDIYWNETKSGINIHEYDFIAIWKPGRSDYTTYRIDEYKKEREIQLRNLKLESILNG